MDGTIIDRISSLSMDSIETLTNESRRLRDEALASIAEPVETVEPVKAEPKEEEMTPEMRGFCKWVMEQYYLAMEDPEWVAADKKYREVLEAEGEEAAEPYLPKFKVRHKKERAPAGTGTLSCKSAEKSKVKNSAKKSIPQKNQKVK